MTLAVGTRLGPYEIAAPIGAGGMGEVYRAKDTRLDRTVALKVLPEHLAANPDLRQRFEREARAVSSLNHPHICTLFDVGHQDGIDFLVMEHLEGETLGDRLVRGPLPTEQVLRYGTEMADALDKAHRQGIVHRDLKPGNVMLTKTGAKLLDFGLAKLQGATAAPAASVLSALATGERPLTEHGTVLGTFQYMAPEQLEAKEADARTDIFALGSILYEMATGKRAFAGKSQASLIAAILSAEPPPLSSLQPMAPPALERLVKVCLAKDPDDRLQTAHDVMQELKWIAEAGSAAGVPAPLAARRKRRERLAWALAAVGFAAAIFSIGFAIRSSSQARSTPRTRPGVVRFAIGESPGRLDTLPESAVALSRDGSRLLYVAERDGKSGLFLRAMSQIEAVRLPSTEGADHPFFSPDAKWAGFFADGKLKKVSLEGGAPVSICSVAVARGATWAPDDTIFFSSSTDSGLWRVPASGGEPQAVTRPDPARGERTHRWPVMLPGGKAILLTVGYSDIVSFDDARLAVLSLETGKVRELMKGGSWARYATSGHLLYARAGAVLAVPFSQERLEVTGTPMTVLDRVVTYPGSGAAQFAMSETGSVAYIPGGATDADQVLVWVDRHGRRTPLPIAPAPFLSLQISPDGGSVALDIDAANANIWIYDLARGQKRRLTLEWSNNGPAWAPDGTRVSFNSARGGRRSLFWQAVDGSGQAEPLTTSEYLQQGGSWSPDGKVVVFSALDPAGQLDLRVVSLNGDRKPTPFLRTSFDESRAKFSPDGRFIAYVSNEAGREEVYVQAYPGPGRKWLISNDGGTSPVWARSGKELFYRAGEAMMNVEVAAVPVFSAGPPRMLFTLPGLFAYDVAPDGQRFLMIQAKEQVASHPPIEVALDWSLELTRRLQSGR